MAENTATLEYVAPYADDLIDFRQMFAPHSAEAKADQALTGDARYQSAYVLFVPGFRGAPKSLRTAGRTTLEVPAALVDELLTHPVWRFMPRERKEQIEAEARKRAADHFGPIMAERLGNPAAVPVASPSVAESLPSDPAAVIAGAKAEAKASGTQRSEGAKN